jgi:hypothetical protein
MIILAVLAENHAENALEEYYALNVTTHLAM